MAWQRYSVEHETRYAYRVPVAQSWQLAHLTPRVLPWQRLRAHELHIEPRPDERRDALDSFGNCVTHFSLHAAHADLGVSMRSMGLKVRRRGEAVAGLRMRSNEYLTSVATSSRPLCVQTWTTGSLRPPGSRSSEPQRRPSSWWARSTCLLGGRHS